MNNQPVASQLDTDEDDQDVNFIENQSAKSTGNADLIEETHSPASNFDRQLDEFSSSPAVMKSPPMEIRKPDLSD